MSAQLKKYQEEFLQSVHPATWDKQESNLKSKLIGAGKLSTQQALQVYTQDYIIRMTEVLGDHYGACWKVLGDDDFLSFCEEYIKENPSSYKSLSQYGEGFSSFLLSKVGDDYDFISALASFEFSFQRLFHAPAISESLSEDLLFNHILTRIEESFFILSEVNLIHIWNNKDREEELLWEDIETRGLYILYKEEYTVKQLRINSVFQKVLDDLNSGRTLVQSIEQYEEDPDFSTLSEEDWASFFYVVMRTYKIR